jgi:GST-like protein
MLGDVYTIVDMSVWGWGRPAQSLLGAETWSKMTNVKRLFDEINARPAVARVDKLKDRHAFKQEFDEDARRHLFPHMMQKAS